MGIFSSIKDAIFGHKAKAATPPTRPFPVRVESGDSLLEQSMIQNLCWAGGRRGWHEPIHRICGIV